MDKETAKRIDELLYDSDLFSSKPKSQKEKVSFDFSDETILITGAAGSIGNGLTKQLISSKYKKLILVDIAESPLYELIKELEFEDTNRITFLILNVTSKDSLEHLFDTHKPSIVFHTAAYKHVPLMESVPYEAVKLNILATKLLADLSNDYLVEKFIFISTDKAVNPLGIMGISKRIGEKYLNFLNTKSSTKYLITRFGNIFGSNGSVIPLLKKQIEFERPLTITDNNMTRYFISKYKACNLILKLASNKSFHHNLYTFNMGEPIKIIDIINRITTSYYNLETKPNIKVIGLRLGEKLHEEILSKEESFVETDNLNILAVKTTNFKNEINFVELENITPSTSNSEIKKILLQYI